MGLLWTIAGGNIGKPTIKRGCQHRTWAGHQFLSTTMRCPNNNSKKSKSGGQPLSRQWEHSHEICFYLPPWVRLDRWPTSSASVGAVCSVWFIFPFPGFLSCLYKQSDEFYWKTRESLGRTNFRLQVKCHTDPILWKCVDECFWILLGDINKSIIWNNLLYRYTICFQIVATPLLILTH